MTNSEYWDVRERAMHLSPSDTLLILDAAHGRPLTAMNERHLQAIDEEVSRAYFRRKRRKKMRGSAPVVHRPVSQILSEYGISTMPREEEGGDEPTDSAAEKKRYVQPIFWQVLCCEKRSAKHDEELARFIEPSESRDAFWCAAGCGEWIRQSLLQMGHPPPTLMEMFSRYQLGTLPEADREVVLLYIVAERDPSDEECVHFQKLRKNSRVEALLSAELDCVDR